ncbi:MAG: DEAD/DEAH box helicase family protein [Patescibacteria group bacterium]
MKLKFDANQDFQLDAIKAVVDLFEGQNKTASKVIAGSGLLGIYPNVLTLSQEEILANSSKVQTHNGTVSGGVISDLDFSVEMETGTGKTYVYLRTVFELNKKYGWKKFIIFVPSVAIREGVVKTLNITKDHFADLYDNVPYRFYEYQSRNISQVKHFADSSNIEIMVMTIGAFNKDSNVLYSERDQMHGEQPISYIQKTNPILILDEPQNMEGESTKKALENFNSLFRLRYSATHKNVYNLVYQLAPYDAYQLGLVKKIEVFSVVDEDNTAAAPLLNLIEVKPSKTALKAQIEVVAKDDQGNSKKKKVSVKQGDDLAKKTGNASYEGFVVDELTADAPDFGSIGSVRFRNNIQIKQGEGIGGNREDIMKEQIAETIKLHFEKKNRLKELGIKVLSLFFIDRVDNYVKDDGFIRQTFIEQFNKLKKENGEGGTDVNAVHKGYFAMKNATEYIERESAIAENKEAYELIMKDKERLLSFDEPTEFIFSHSALKEGWDNPNIFNICTLNLTSSSMKKRQEIGRGMRLCVNQDGERIFLKNVNLLSVIANESYSSYVAGLQSEFVEDGIYKAAPAPHNAKRKVTVKLKKGFDHDENFQAIWNRISKKTRYVVRVNTTNVIERTSKRIQELKISKPQIKIERAGIAMAKEGIDATILGGQSQALSQTRRMIDCVELIKSETKLTRETIAAILQESGNFKSLANNPDRFIYEVTKIIREELVRDYIEQVSYEVVPEKYDVAQFENIPSYKDSVEPINHSIYDAIVYDSEVEQKFAVDLDRDERIKLFIKLPGWFKIETPVGGYNPDWAIVTAKRDLRGNEDREKVYFVIETKGGTNLRASERAKIDSAKKHFEVIAVNYKEINSGYQQFNEECLT